MSVKRSSKKFLLGLEQINITREELIDYKNNRLLISC